MISVIMSTYNENVDILEIAINSVLSQTFSDFEFLIGVDNPDNDEIIDLLNEKSKIDPRIYFYVNEHNIGLTKTLNSLISRANGSIIARMDADDVSKPKRFEIQTKYLHETGYDIISCDVEVIDENGARIHYLKNLPNTHEKTIRKLRYNNCMPHPGWMVRANVYQALGGYREIPYCEDYDFLLRAVKNNFYVGNVNEVLLSYRMTKKSISRSNLFKQYISMKYVQEKAFSELSSNCSFEDYNNNLYSKLEEEKYNRSAEIFTSSLQLCKPGHIIKSCIGFVQAFSGSKYYRDKMKKYILQVIG